MVRKRTTAPAPPLVLSPLSPRERQLLTAIADGNTRNWLAVEWGISIGTINNHMRIILAKLSAKTAEQAVAKAYRNGFIS